LEKKIKKLADIEEEKEGFERYDGPKDEETKVDTSKKSKTKTDKTKKTEPSKKADNKSGISPWDETQPGNVDNDNIDGM